MNVTSSLVTRVQHRQDLENTTTARYSENTKHREAEDTHAVPSRRFISPHRLPGVFTVEQLQQHPHPSSDNKRKTPVEYRGSHIPEYIMFTSCNKTGNDTSICTKLAYFHNYGAEHRKLGRWKDEFNR